MNTKEAITLIQLTQGATIVAATYLDTSYKPSERVYHFKNVIGADLKPGDIAVAETRDTIMLVRIVAVDVPHYKVGCSVELLKHIVQKVQLDALDRVKHAEHKAANELAMSELHERLAAMQAQIGSDSLGRVRNLLAPSVAAFTAKEYPNAVKDEVLEDVMASAVKARSKPQRAETHPSEASPLVETDFDYIEGRVMAELTRGMKP